MVLMYRSTGATIGVCADVEWLMAVLPIILRHYGALQAIHCTFFTTIMFV